MVEVVVAVGAVVGVVVGVWRKIDMKLYLLTADYDRVYYDCFDRFIVRANDELEARKLAAAESSDEGEETWLDPKFSECQELTSDGPVEIILGSFNAG